jgi:hypothetical protein
MSKKAYNVITTTRTAQPRSKRLRALGTSGTASGGSSVTVSGGTQTASEGHSHANKTLLDSLSNDDEGYLYLRQTRDDSEEASTEKVKAGYADEAGHADEADYADEAGKLRDEMAFIETLAQYFLSKTKDDNAAGLITFLQGLVSEGSVAARKGATFGDFVKSLYAGSGAGVDGQGNMEVESLRVRSAMEVLELVVNRLSAIEGDQLLTEADTIESVDNLGDNCYGLHLRSKWEGYFTAQVENNVIKGIINTLAGGSGEYYTSWMRVNSVNTASNYIEVTLYSDDEVPAGKNYPPCGLMKIARWGNQTDTTRQKCLYLSSTEGCIKKLVNVTKPITDSTNEGLKVGDVPDWLKDDVRVDANRDYLYAMGVICQDFIQVDYKGQPVPTYVDRGAFVQGAKYRCRSYNESNQYEISDVWSAGCKWRCQKDLTTTAPAWNNTDWAMIEGNPNFSVDFAEPEQLYDIDNFRMPLTVVATLYNMDVTDDILDSDVQWTRYTEDADGNPRTASDNLWALNHAGSGKAIVIAYGDLDADTSSGFPKTIRFTATVTLRDGMGETAAEDSVTRAYF